MRKPISFLAADRAAESILDLLVIVFAVLLFVVIFVATGDAQTTAIYSFPPPSQPACSATFDTTNKLVVTSCTVNGVAVGPISYNPRALEGNAGGVFTITFGGITITYTHNLAADPLKYTVGSTAAGSAALVQCGSSPSPACPVIPW